MNGLFSFKKITLAFFIIVSCVTLYARFIFKQDPFPEPRNINEKFNPSLSTIDTPEKLDSIVRRKFENSGHDTARTLLFMDEFFRNKFYHSYSELSLHDNWIAFFCGKIFWSHFLNPVVPADIIRFPMAGCSQQGILFQNQLNHLSIPCSSIEFYPQKYQKSGHYTVTAYYGGSWHYFDTNLEPVIIDSTMPSIENIIERKLYDQMYTKEVHKNFKEYFINKSFKRVDADPFRKGNMYYFQTTTNFLSDWLWILFLTLYLILYFKAKK